MNPIQPESEAIGPLLAPNAAPWPFTRFIFSSLFGLTVGFSYLANKFQRYWGLGVTTNWCAALYMLAGMIPASLLDIAGGYIGQVPLIKSASPLAADFIGIAFVLLAPHLPLGSRQALGGREHMEDLPIKLSRNSIFAILEEMVIDRVANRLQDEVLRASANSSWRAIKRAAQKSLVEEHALLKISEKVFKDETLFIAALPDQEMGADNDNDLKYLALYHILRPCRFRRLERHLQAGMREVNS